VGLVERTWAAWCCATGEACLLDDLAGQQDSMPILVLDGAEAVPSPCWRCRSGFRNKTLGALILLGRRGSFGASTARVLGTLANQAAATLSVIQLKEVHKQRSVRDVLTGLYNRREFNRLLEQAIGREDRQKGRFALLLLDIDHFKKLNDTYGHPAGDAALKNTAQVIETRLRKGDQAARFGGEEFVAILPGADEAGALHLADRIRSAVQQAELAFEGARLLSPSAWGSRSGRRTVRTGHPAGVSGPRRSMPPSRLAATGGGGLHAAHASAPQPPGPRRPQRLSRSS
jgi:diguanylate cyclase (GGDEF)-like protein